MSHCPSLRSGSLTVITLMALLLLSLPLSGQTLTPDSGPSDPSQYRHLTLENGMGVLLVSNPRVDKAAASLDVMVGSGDDPEDRPGLAHFTEHMLFLGTENYPDPAEYHAFISDHGGRHNAYTAFQETNYFFDIDARHLEAALDRFSSQFLAPTFAEELIERERMAVHSEFTAMRREDNRRFWSALQASLNPEHSLSTFTVGNRNTLSNEENELRQDVVDFYEAHYSANLMKLVVVGPQSLDELESMVRPRFSGVENRQHERKEHKSPFYKEGSLPHVMKVKSLRETRRLQLLFPIPSLEEEYASKPSEYLAHLIGHEGPGSLHDVLRSAGLVNEVSAGRAMDTGQQALMSISLTLTEAGLERWEDVVSVSFDYLEQIRRDGISKDYFDELQRIKALELQFQEQSKPISQASELSSRLHRVAPEDVVVAPYLMEEYRPETYRNILAKMTPDNLQASLLAPFDTDDSWEKTRWYETPYSITPLEVGSVMDRDGTSELSAGLSLPEPNPFIPEDLSLVPGEDMEKPVRIAESPLDLWYARDTRFDSPRATIKLNLRSPAANDSPRSHVLTKLMLESVEDELSSIAYAARVADLDYSLNDHLRGVTLQLSGYNDKMPRLLDEILLRLRHPLPEKERFELHRRQLIDELGNELKRRPQQIAVSKVSETLVPEIYSVEERLDAARKLTLEDLYEHMQAFYQALDPVMLVHGNITHAGARSLGSQVRARVLDKSDTTETRRSRVRQLPREKQWLYATVDHSDTGYVRYLQADSASPENQARYRLLAQSLSSPFFDSLRTDQQLGYIVHAAHYPLLDVPSLALIVQSPDRDADTIDERVQAFLEDFESRLSGMSSEDFEQQKAAVITRLSEEETRLREISERYWQEIDRQNWDFDTRETLIDLVGDLKQDQVVRTYRREILENPRQLVIDASRESTKEAAELQPLSFAGWIDTLSGVGDQ
ncbi:MAG: insulinase family protein [Oleiphilaceae bacterium]|nr:insulinase family protein [Oleiphilaceae bacterium]